MNEGVQLATMIKAIPDVDIEDMETPEDTEAHIKAMKEYEAGETIAFEDVNWD